MHVVNWRPAAAAFTALSLLFGFGASTPAIATESLNDQALADIEFDAVDPTPDESEESEIPEPLSHAPESPLELGGPLEIPDEVPSHASMTRAAAPALEASEYLMPIEPGKPLGRNGRYVEYGSPVNPWNWASAQCSAMSTVGNDLLIISACESGKLTATMIDPRALKTISRKTTTISNALPKVGGVQRLADGNIYLVTGQDNPNEDDNREVIRVSKYSTSLTLLGAASLYSRDVTLAPTRGVTVPFDAGSTRMTLGGTTLYVHTAKKMYTSPRDGYQHQSNLTLSLDSLTMTGLRQRDLSYASHSFNQFIQSYNNGQEIALVDHGDAYPRQIIAADAASGTVDSTRRFSLVDLQGATGDNATYATVNGLEISGTTAIVVGTSAPHNNAIQGVTGTPSNQADQYASNVYVATTDLKGAPGNRRFSWVSNNHPVSSRTIVGQPTLTALPGGQFAVLYQTTTPHTYERDLEFRLIDASGSLLASKTFAGFAYLPATDPVSIGTSLYWATVPQRETNHLDDNGTEHYLMGLDMTTPSNPVLLKAPENLFTNAPVPTISGTANVDATVKAITGTWTPTPGTVAYQWYRNGIAITGATRSAYVLELADHHAEISVSITAILPGYRPTTRTSAAVRVGHIYDVPYIAHLDSRGASGRGVTGASIEISTMDNKRLCTVTVISGIWSCSFSPEATPNTLISIMGTKDNFSGRTFRVVPVRTLAPTVTQSLTTGAVGTGISGATITITTSQGQQLCSTTVVSGRWSCNFTTKPAVNTIVTVAQQAPGLSISDPAKSTIKNPSSPSATPVVQKVSATAISGTGVTGATIKVSTTQGRELCTTTVKDKAWSCTFSPAIAAGTPVNVTQQEPSKLVSGAANAAVPTPPLATSAAPKISKVSTTTISGTGITGALITVVTSNNLPLCATIVTAQKWSCTFTTTQKNGSTLKVNQTESGKLPSTITSITVSTSSTPAPTTPPPLATSAAPKISKVSTTTISGTGITGALITVVTSNNLPLCATIVTAQKWSCTFTTTQKNGSTLKVNQTESGKLPSTITSITVSTSSTPAPTTPPPLATSAAPKISKLSTTTISGTGITGALITVVTSNNLPLCATIVTAQKWSCTVSPALASGTVVAATQIEPKKLVSARTTATVPQVSPTPPAVPTMTRVRHSGPDRYATSLTIAQQYLQKGKPLFVATGASFPDALSVSPAAAKTGGSLILTNPRTMDPAMIALITQRTPSAIYIIGGTSAVSEHIHTQLHNAVGAVKIVRISGDSRYQTSAKIYEQFFVNDIAYKNTSVFIATGRDFPDALSASAAAGSLNQAVLLVDGKGTTPIPETSALLKKQGATHAAIVGGTGVIGANITRALGKQLTTTRHAGANRYDTNLAVNSLVGKTAPTPTDFWFATGSNFPDALSAAVQAGKPTARLYLASRNCAPAQAVSQITQKNSAVRTIHVVGGTTALSDKVLSTTACTQ